MYSIEFVKTFMKNGGGCDEASRRGYGMAEGGSIAQQHRAALDLWEKALALDGPDALNEYQRAVALREIARSSAALELPVSAPNRYGPPPDFKRQAV